MGVTSSLLLDMFTVTKVASGTNLLRMTFYIMAFTYVKSIMSIFCWVWGKVFCLLWLSLRKGYMREWAGEIRRKTAKARGGGAKKSEATCSGASRETVLVCALPFPVNHVFILWTLCPLYKCCRCMSWARMWIRSEGYIGGVCWNSAPSQPVPCTNEKEACIQCYRENSKVGATIWPVFLNLLGCDTLVCVIWNHPCDCSVSELSFLCTSHQEM